MYNDIVEKKKSISTSKIKSLGKKKYFHENFRHVFWFNVQLIICRQLITSKELMNDFIVCFLKSMKVLPRIAYLKDL